MVPGREGGQPLDVDAEQSGEGVGLGVAEGRELLGDALHRAVALAQLDPREATGTDGSGGGSEAVGRQRGDEGARAGRWVGAGRGELPGIPGLETGDALAGEVRDGVGADLVVEVAQGLRGQAVVVRGKRLVAGVGDDEGSGGSAATPGLPTDRVVLDDITLLGQRIQMAAHGCCGQAEPSADLGGGDGAVLGDDGKHPRAGALVQVLRHRLGVHVDLVDKHHAIVT